MPYQGSLPFSNRSPFSSFQLVLALLSLFLCGATSFAQTSARKSRAQARPLTAAEHRQAEQQLADLGYWTGRVDGRWDDASRHALIAFQKVEGLKRTGQMTRADFNKLMTAQRPTARETGPAHVEVDLRRQVLFLVDDSGTVSKVLPVSTGSGKEFKSEGWVRDAITHPGRYKVYIKIPGWKKSALGLLYYPSYFMVGTAIHGYPSVPTKPASHGCIRIPMFASKEFYRLTPLGTPVIVHQGDNWPLWLPAREGEKPALPNAP
ncbi:MAG: murein L,D-transpeptidase [Acidobacteria bacterium]|nr:murein L,D-transpeptidase [Acidobacteriota bacterium]